MVIVTLQIGSLIVVRNGVFFTHSRLDSSAHRVSFSQKSSSIRSGSAGLKKNCYFDLKKAHSGLVCASYDGELESHSAICSLLEKEFTFSPTFDEYVKVMDSVRTERSRGFGEEGDLQGERKKSVRRDGSKTGRIAEERNLAQSKNQLSKRKIGFDAKVRSSTIAKGKATDQNHGSAWSLVEGILDKKAKEKRYLQSRGVGEVLRIGGNGMNKKPKEGNIIFEKNRATQRMRYMPKCYKIARANDGNGAKRKFKGAEIGVDAVTFEKKRTSRWRQESHENRGELGRMEKSGTYKVTDDDLGQGDCKQLNQLKSFGCDLSCEGNMISKSKTSEFAEIAHKDEPSFRYGKASKLENLREDKVEAIVMEEKNLPGFDFPTSTKEACQKGSRRRNDKFNGDTVESDDLDSGTLVSSGILSKRNADFPIDSGVDIDGIDIEDRAAFRTFEIFTDVRNRPRVLRMELEEKIQNLAKWLNATDINMPEWQFSKMIHSAKIKFSEHSILRIIQILGSFGNWRRVLQVIEWFHSRERFKYYKSRYIYTTALSILGKAKRPMEALNIFHAMRQGLSSYPDLAAYHCIAVTLGQAGLMKELFDVIDCMRAVPAKKFDLGPLQKWDPRLEPDLVVYNAVLNACIQQKQWEGTFWVLQELKQHKIQPSSTSYGLIMEVMLACGKYDLVYEFFKKSQKNSIPGALNYKVLVNALWQEGKIEEAVHAVKNMEGRGIVGCASLYYDLARCLCSAGRCQEALQQINKISKVAKKPLVVTYTGLIQACLNSKSIENAAYIFNQMHKFCSPNLITYNIMLKAYVEYGKFDEAKNLFGKILAGSHEISSKAELSQKVLPDKFTFNTMMEACAATSNWDDFENCYREMLHHGYHFDVKRHMKLVFDAYRAGKRHILEMSWDHLVSNGRIPPPAIVKELFCMKMEEDEPASAISFIAINQNMKVEAFSENSWLNLLQKKVQHVKIETLRNLLCDLRKKMISEDDRPHLMYQNLLNACERFAASSNGDELINNSQ
ncbi:Pentatricopeptide repeat-containing protein [Apostasia shenzhenica]|uniref:Pentatricopeptide repeat-containing protein n=1 Tax=Apostasia shenzhenica TaxID=1088818 RepID=A0A2I0B2U2_9ASPA|nr:Pentatricopeptide repeat-containing protein [Apostasia shenzhenica]